MLKNILVTFYEYVYKYLIHAELFYTNITVNNENDNYLCRYFLSIIIPYSFDIMSTLVGVLLYVS